MTSTSDPYSDDVKKLILELHNLGLPDENWKSTMISKTHFDEQKLCRVIHQAHSHGLLDREIDIDGNLVGKPCLTAAGHNLAISLLSYK